MRRLFPKRGIDSYASNRCRAVGVGDFPAMEALSQAISDGLDEKNVEKGEIFHIYFYGEKDPEFIEFQETIKAEFTEGGKKEERAFLASGKSFNRRRIMENKNQEKPVVIQVKLRILDGKQKKEAYTRDNEKKKIVAEEGVYVQVVDKVYLRLTNGIWVEDTASAN